MSGRWGNGTRLVADARNFYHWAMSKDDPRTRHWLFIQSPAPSVCWMFGYFFVAWIGPKLMENRKPVNLGHWLTIYNFAMVIVSSYTTYEFFMSAYLAGYSLGCQDVDYSTDPLALRMASVCWLYYFSKYIETADTVFFILRKKNNQITFLHVFHHGTMIFNWWLCVKYIAGGVTFFHPLLNSFVHVIMYSYYGLSALGPAIQPYLWWKKYVTLIQVSQFIIILIHSLYVTTQCNFELGFCLLAVGYAVIMITLFTNYYYHERRRVKERHQQQKRLDLKNQ